MSNNWCSDPKQVKCKKPFRCYSCGEMIQPGEAYEKWVSKWYGDFSQCKMHSECLAQHQKEAELYGEWEFSMYEHPRPECVNNA